jgi:hypothetical protein
MTGILLSDLFVCILDPNRAATVATTENFAGTIQTATVQEVQDGRSTNMSLMQDRGRFIR